MNSDPSLYCNTTLSLFSQDSADLLTPVDPENQTETAGNSDKNNNKSGLDSKSFDININGVETKWSLSIRFWTGDDGERLVNPFVVCLNMNSCRYKITFIDQRMMFDTSRT